MSAKLRVQAERKRQALVAEMCSDAINVLLDDTGPLAALPPEVKAKVQGELDSVVRTLTAEMEAAEGEAQ